MTHDNLADAERILLEELRDKSSSFQLSPKQTRVRAAARRLEFDLLRYLRSEADSDSRFEPAELERDFGFERRRARWSSAAACACAGESTAWTSTTAWRS